MGMDFYSGMSYNRFEQRLDLKSVKMVGFNASIYG